jgi:hypothetical protein
MKKCFFAVLLLLLTSPVFGQGISPNQVIIFEHNNSVGKSIPMPLESGIRYKMFQSLDNLDDKVSFLIAQEEGDRVWKMAPHEAKIITPQESPEMKGADTSPATKPESAKAISSGPRFDLFEELEDNTDRPGNNYGDFNLPHPELELCLMECQNDPRCKAFTYVRPGFQGPKARCWLKDAVPTAKPSPCCISGVKKAGATQGRAITPMKPMTGAIEIVRKPSTGTPAPQQAGGHPAQSALKEKDINLKIPPVSSQRPLKSLNRRELVNILLKNPRTAPQLNQFASTMGVTSQKLATQSSTGKVITGGPITVPPSGMTKNWNWETGVRFTPRSTQVNMEVCGVRIFQKQGYEYGLSDMYHRDELYLAGRSGEAYFRISVPTPPGKYIITVELEAPGMGVNDNLFYNCPECESHEGLLPIIDKKTFADQVISSYIGQFEVGSTNMTTHIFEFPEKFSYTTWGIFRGITFTRL